MAGLARDRNAVALIGLALILTLLVGFGPSFFLRPVLGAAPGYAAPEPIFYAHGFLFSAWFAFLALQIWLVRSGSVALHRSAGRFGVALAVLIVAVGVYVSLVAANRPGGFIGAPAPPHQFLIVPLFDMIAFAVFAGLAFAWRRDAPAHKRLMLLASIALIEAAVARIPLMFALSIPNIDVAVIAGLVALVLIWDVRTLGRPHPVTLVGGGLFVLAMPFRLAVAESAPWQAFGRFAMGLVGSP